MRVRHASGVLYGLLAAFMIAQGSWWALFLHRQAAVEEERRLAALAREADRAEAVLDSLAVSGSDPVAADLRERFPGVGFEISGEFPRAFVSETARAAARHEAYRERRMFLYEGAFFLLVLVGGSAVLVRARLRENDYRRARELFLAGVTHEFKTPLASLRLYTETLDRPDLGDEERGRIRGLLVRDVQRMERLVGQVLTAARDRPSRAHLREPFDLSEEAEAVLRGMEGFLTRESARLVTELPRGRSVKGERAAFSIALRNLVENAVLHSPQPAEVRVTLSSESAWHRVSVRDRGPGIPRRHRRSIFRGFFRIEAEDASSSRGARGTGLGLYLVKRNAEALGGRVEVRSGSDGGSVFTLVLPAYFGGEAL